MEGPPPLPPPHFPNSNYSRGIILCVLGIVAESKNVNYFDGSMT